MISKYYFSIFLFFLLNTACSNLAVHEMTKYDTRHLAKGDIAYKVSNTWVKEPARAVQDS